MAKREALRDLQSRLAERLQAVAGEAPSAAWLAVHCAGQALVFPLHTAGEIFPAQGIVPVPHARPWFLGVANLRGGLHGVVDLAGFLGVRGRALAADALPDGARLVAINPERGPQCALLIDRLAGLRNATQLTRLAAAEQGARPAFAGARYRDEQGQEWQEIDLGALARHEAFLAIAG